MEEEEEEEEEEGLYLQLETRERGQTNEANGGAGDLGGGVFMPPPHRMARHRSGSAHANKCVFARQIMFEVEIVHFSLSSPREGKSRGGDRRDSGGNCVISGTLGRSR